MTARYDILIVDIATGRVSSVAAYALPDEYVGERRSTNIVIEELLPRLKHGLTAEAHPAGTYRKDDILPVDEFRERLAKRLSDTVPRAPRASRKGDSYTLLQKERQADGQCIRCGSPHLVTKNHCEPCNNLVLARASQSRANSL